MLKRFAIYFLVVLFSCNKVSNNLTTTLAIDPAIEKVSATDTTSYLKCSNFEFYMEPNSNIKSSNGNTLFYARAHKFKNQLRIMIEGCASNGNDYITISIVDSTFLVAHTVSSDTGETPFVPITQELIINKYPIEYGDTISGKLTYRGIALKDKWKLDADFQGMFSVVVIADTSLTYHSILDGLPAANYVQKIKMIGIEDINRIGQFKNLKQLDITDKTYSGEFPSEILSLKYLEKLELACNVSELPEQIGNLENLKNLNLWGNHTLKELPKNLVRCKRLKAINLRQNEGVILNSLKGFDSLQHLNLSEIDLSKLPDAITTLRTLRTLDLSGNSRLNFTNVFNELSQIKSLEQLELRYCKLERLPNSFLALKNLKKINLSWNPLEVGELQRLRSEMPNTEIEFFEEHE